jgi:hypothetical protein
MCLRVRGKKKIRIFFSLKSLKKEVGSGSISQRYGSADTDPQHWITDTNPSLFFRGSRDVKGSESADL